MESSVNDETEDGGSLLNQANAGPFSVIAVEYIKVQHLYRILIPPAHVLFSFCVRIGAFDFSRVFVLVQVFRVPCTLFIGVHVQRTNVDHYG